VSDRDPPKPTLVEALAGLNLDQIIAQTPRRSLFADLFKPAPEVEVVELSWKTEGGNELPPEATSVRWSQSVEWVPMQLSDRDREYLADRDLVEQLQRENDRLLWGTSPLRLLYRDHEEREAARRRLDERRQLTDETIDVEVDDD